MVSSAAVFSLEVALAIWSHLWFCMNFTVIVSSISVKIVIGIFMEVTLCRSTG